MGINLLDQDSYMMTQLKCFQASTIDGISKVIGDTNSGLSGSVISQYLTEMRIIDIDPTNTKWKRLYHALINNQNEVQCANNILNFIKHIMKPVRYVNDMYLFEYRRNELNKVLSFEGYEISERGGIVKTDTVKTISEAHKRANNFRTKLKLRNVHSRIFIYCDEKLLAENYFHSVLEAAKSIFDRIREISNIQQDGASLIDAVLGGEFPMLIINRFVTESEKSEHKGFSNLLKGLYSMFRNPTAHEVKIKWDITEEDALDIMSIISYCHKRLDNTQKIRL
jgi:uncharacterized protein (TIGR02391 family)